MAVLRGRAELAERCDRPLLDPNERLYPATLYGVPIFLYQSPFIEALDRERSDYARHVSERGEVLFIREHVIREDRVPSGRHLFRVQPRGGWTFASAAAREALESVDCRGIAFQPVETTAGG